jgi:hypothetical protein
VRADSRSGALTGGGTTATLDICTRVEGTSRLTLEGAGGITRAFNVGLERTCSSVTCEGAGAITLALSEGAARLLWPETLGAGEMMLGSRTGAKSVCSL